MSSVDHALQISHQALQLPSLAARANLAALADDSQSNFGWRVEDRSFVSHFMGPEETIQAGLSLARRSLVLLEKGEIISETGLGEDNLADRFDVALSTNGLATTQTATLPYDLKEGVSLRRANDFATEFTVLANVFDIGFTTLDAVSSELSAMSIAGARCWPHHYDIGMLVTLEEGDPESARSVGMGMSPGDEAIGTPYFYCSPWPPPDSDRLNTLPQPSRWHTDGFTSAVTPLNEFSDSSETSKTMKACFQACLETLG